MGKRKDGLQKNSEKFQNIIVEGDKKKKKKKLMPEWS